MKRHENCFLLSLLVETSLAAGNDARKCHLLSHEIVIVALLCFGFSTPSRARRTSCMMPGALRCRLQHIALPAGKGKLEF